MNKSVRLPWRIMLLLAACAPGQSALGATVQRTPVASENPAAAPAKALEEANDAARVQPERADFRNAIQQYVWADGALFQVYATPGRITDIILQEGETLTGPGPVAAGDTARWIIGDTVSGTGDQRRVHILLKPTRAGIATNLIINTDRRTYHLELRATTSTHMAAISWTYPRDTLIAIHAREAEQARTAPLATGIDVTALNFRYKLRGDKPDWRPLRVFDDGRQVFIEFPESVARGDMPPLFVIGDTGDTELVNYRVAGRYMIVDRLFGRAQLKLVSGKREISVLIDRETTRAKARS